LRRHIYGLINNINDDLLNFLHNMDNHIEDIFVLIKDELTTTTATRCSTSSSCLFCATESACPLLKTSGYIRILRR
jgi:hypothetical protein